MKNKCKFHALYETKIKFERLLHVNHNRDKRVIKEAIEGLNSRIKQLIEEEEEHSCEIRKCEFCEIRKLYQLILNKNS